jgi:DNA-binding transcriptional ArsR family regulator
MAGSDVFRALADPSRRRILDLLRRGSLSAGEIGEHFTFTAASLSHHLSVLKEAGLVRAERRGQNIVYSLDTTVLEDALSLLVSLVHKTS